LRIRLPFKVIQIYKDPDGNPLKRGDKGSVLSRGARYSQSIDALQNRSRIDQAEREAEEVKPPILSKSLESFLKSLFLKQILSYQIYLVLSLINKINPTIVN